MTKVRVLAVDLSGLARRLDKLELVSVVRTEILTQSAPICPGYLDRKVALAALVGSGLPVFDIVSNLIIRRLC